MRGIDSISGFKDVIRTWSPDLCSFADFANFNYKTLDICSQQNK